MKANLKILGGILAVLVAAAGCASTAQHPGLETSGLPGRTNELVDTAVRTLREVSGPDQAMAAQATLMDVEAELDDVVKQAAEAPPATRQELAGIAAAAHPLLMSAAEQAMGIAGVSDVLGPSIARLDGILKQLSGR